MMIITSKNNPFIKETASLKEKKGRKQLGAFLVEGKKMAEECRRSEFLVERVFLAESYLEVVPFPEEICVRVSDELFRFLSDEKTPQGILCRVKIPTPALRAPSGRCLILDGVADPGNLGTIIRTANAAGYQEIYLTTDCTDAYSPKSVRASMSGIFFTTVYQGTREEILSVMQGFPVFVADMVGENVFTFTPPKAFALVIGNEANGVSKELKGRADASLTIPMRNEQESLNAAIAAGIAMYELARVQMIEKI